MNSFVAALAGICAAQRFAEKRLVAPTRRVGNQWLEAAARAGGASLNVRVDTLRSLAIELASPLLARDGLTVVPRRAEALLAGRLLRDLPPRRLRHLGAAAPGPGLAATVLATLAELRRHAVPAARLRAGVIEERGKAADLRLLAREYEALLAAERLADHACVLRLAAERLAADPDALGPDTLVLLPADVELKGLERSVLDGFPALRLVRLAVDAPGLPAEVRFGRAVGEGNEVRAVLRSCLERGIPLDEVEVLHTDAAGAAWFAEALAGLDRPGAGEGTDAVIDAPVTFAGGLPATLSRPGRALGAWLAWLAAGCPQPALVAMVREGLLEAGPAEGGGSPGFARLAALLRAIPIGAGRDRYLGKIDEEIGAVRARLDAAEAGPADGAGDGADREETPEERTARLAVRLAALDTLRGMVARVLDVSPADDARAAVLVACARRFLADCARAVGRLDAFAAERLGEELDTMASWLGRAGGGSAADARAWLEALPGGTTVMGSGPRPGRLHVDTVRGGGHSGRPHTFILGLDDARFPGAGLQDPLLLDGERRRLDAALPTAAGRLEETVRDFRRLLGRLRGEVTLSWVSRDVAEDAERSPSQTVLDVFREARGAPQAELADLTAAAGPPASFAPASPARALDPAEWRLWRFTADEAVANPGEVLARRAPHVARGLAAAAARAGEAFTAWDGRVPLAGDDLDPTSPGGAVLSSNGLETAGACPRRFFYRYALGIEPPDELLVDPARWLDPLTTGSLLHELFEEFVREIVRLGRYANVERARGTILSMLKRKLEACRRRHPVPSEAVFRREHDLLVTAAETFVREEHRHVLETGSEPVYLEASFGLPPGGHGTNLDHPDPVPVALPDGRTIRTRGRVDRIDHRVSAGGGWEIWDYKSGGRWGYERADPFPEGRKIQPYLYLRMVERRLHEAVDQGALVRSFGYFFPGARGRGARLRWDAARLAAGAEVLAGLCAVIAGGAFAATTDDGDCARCDYRRACGDVAAQAAASRAKVLAGEPLLAPLARLRAASLGTGGEGGGEA